MVRHEKTRGALNVAWGYDDNLRGYFLAVTDLRLEWREGQTPEVDKICKKVAYDGEGHYFDLNTYPVGGNGYRVSKETIFTFMRRYGIAPEKIGTIDAVESDIGFIGTKQCAVCTMPETALKRCAKCKNRWYCSKDCQTDDWRTHKDHCTAPES
ncbi:hypothetical protein BGZ83_009439 [Gryganskiella cystojenkinii]|nr:hypothetical protein BGZ83_009439 [Gryganskiella cystojenkinii]